MTSKGFILIFLKIKKPMQNNAIDIKSRSEKENEKLVCPKKAVIINVMAVDAINATTIERKQESAPLISGRERYL